MGRGGQARFLAAASLFLVGAGLLFHACMSFGLDDRRFRCDDDPGRCGDGLVCGVDGYCSEPGAAEDASTADATAGIGCGNEVCQPPQVCCVFMGGSSVCTPEEECDGVGFGCDSPGDCTVDGEICCGKAGGGTECTSQGECQAPSCQTEAQCPNPNHQCCDIGHALVCQPSCP